MSSVPHVWSYATKNTSTGISLVRAKYGTQERQDCKAKTRSGAKTSKYTNQKQPNGERVLTLNVCITVHLYSCPLHFQGISNHIQSRLKNTYLLACDWVFLACAIAFSHYEHCTFLPSIALFCPANYRVVLYKIAGKPWLLMHYDTVKVCFNCCGGSVNGH